jgi:hypothetical protein
MTNLGYRAPLMGPPGSDDRLPSQQGQLSTQIIRQQVQEVMRILQVVTSILSDLDSAAVFRDLHLSHLVHDIMNFNVDIYEIYRRSNVLPARTYQVLFDAQMEAEDRLPSDEVVQGILSNARQNALRHLTRGMLLDFRSRTRNLTRFFSRPALHEEHVMATMLAPDPTAYVRSSPPNSEADDSEAQDYSDDTVDSNHERTDSDAGLPEASTTRCWEIGTPGCFPHPSIVWKRIDEIIMSYLDDPEATCPSSPELLSLFIGEYVVERRDDDGEWTISWEEEDLGKDVWTVK